MLAAAVTAVLKAISANPALLRAADTKAIGTKLQAQGNATSQGTGNKITDHEASFATVLEANGFEFLPRDADVPEAGLRYVYQLNGTQQSIDFQVQEYAAKNLVGVVNFDLKHSTTDVFFLNDGWFHEDIVYVVTWERKTSAPRKRITRELATFICLGQNMATAEENTFMEKLISMKREMNAEHKTVGSLCPYVRFANRYKCDTFTVERTAAELEAVVTWLGGLKDLPTLPMAAGGAGGAGGKAAVGAALPSETSSGKKKIKFIADEEDVEDAMSQLTSSTGKMSLGK